MDSREPDRVSDDVLAFFPYLGAHGLDESIDDGGDAIKCLDADAALLANRVIDAVRQLKDIPTILEQSAHNVHIKAADGQLLFTNSSYDRFFGHGLTPVGRYPQSFLDEILAPVSKHSDNLILVGCSSAIFDHPGRDAEGQAVLCRTIKKSLLGIGHPKMAILGVTQILRINDSDQSHKLLSLARQWHVFQQLDERDRECAVLLAMGEKSKTIALRYGVTDKTIDNRRATILKVLSLKNTMELTRVLCRLQDNGFSDFGL